MVLRGIWGIHDTEILATVVRECGDYLIQYYSPETTNELLSNASFRLHEFQCHYWKHPTAQAFIDLNGLPTSLGRCDLLQQVRSHNPVWTLRDYINHVIYGSVLLRADASLVNPNCPEMPQQHLFVIDSASDG